MTSVTINTTSPDGNQLALAIGRDDFDAGITPSIIVEMLERANKAANMLKARGWDTAAPHGQVQPALAGPTFCGFACSPVVDALGYPNYIIVDGKQHARREGNGDVWYSVKVAEGQYEKSLAFRKGDQVPAVQGI